MDDVCVVPFAQEKWTEAGEIHFLQHLSQPWFVSVLCAQWDHLLEVSRPFLRKHHGTTECSLWKYMLLWEASSFHALVPGSLGLVESLCHTRSINPTVYQPARPPHHQGEGKLCVLKKATAAWTECHSFCLGLGPGSEIYRPFIIFRKYTKNDLKLSQFSFICRSLLLPVVSGLKFRLDDPREKRMEMQRKTRGPGQGESKDVPCLCPPWNTWSINSVYLKFSKLVSWRATVLPSSIFCFSFSQTTGKLAFKLTIIPTVM